MPPKAKTAPPGKRYPLNMRTTRELREKIEAAARTSGRSLVQEVEFRLEQSFAKEELIERMAAAIDKRIDDQVEKGINDLLEKRGKL